MWERSDYQPEYVPIHAAKPAGDGPAIEVWTVDIKQDTRADDRREAEGRIIAEAIDRWVRVDRRFKFEQVTILFRAFTNISYYLRPLRERGIPFVVDGGREFLKRPEVGQLVATLQAIDRPANQPALLAFLRSPAGGVSDVELASYAKDGGAWSWMAPVDAEHFPGIARSFVLL